jgi:ABC-type multidrug transport system ATPase subunit
MSQIIKVSSLSKSFGAIHAVDNLSFAVDKGDVYGFLGQNGAGKSTTIRMLLGLIQPTMGDIEIMGLSLRRHHREIMRQTGAIIERPDLYKYLSGIENLKIFARLSGQKPDNRKLMDQMEMVGLAERATSKVSTYSQGMKQRLGLAVALVHQPALVILDEPTNGLDPQGIADIRRLILHLSHDLKRTVFVSSHLLSEMEIVANRMLILDKGKKVVEGTVSELLDPSRMVVQLETSNNMQAIDEIRKSKWAEKLNQNNSESQILFLLNREQVPELAADLVKMGIGIISIQPRHSLEDYFLSLIGSNQHVSHTAN